MASTWHFGCITCIWYFMAYIVGVRTTINEPPTESLAESVDEAEEPKKAKKAKRDKTMVDNYTDHKMRRAIGLPF